MARPTPNVAIVTPIICGSIRSPDSVGDTNSESWKYSGRNCAAPYVTTPAHIPRSIDVNTTRFVNNRGGISGSATRSSTATKAAVAIAATANRMSTCCWVQPSLPSSSPIISEPIATESSATPA